jgi:hypothetical protein
MPISLVFAGSTTVTGGSMLDDGYDALRSLAGLRLINNSAISINGTAFPISTVYDLYPDVLCHYNREYRRLHPLIAPDVTQVLGDAVGGFNNPLANFASSESYEGGQKRGAYQYTSITRGATSATILVNLYDWVYLPGILGLDQADDVGLIRIRQLNINDTYQLLDKYAWSHAATGPTTISSLAVTFSATPYIIMKYITPPRELVPQGPLVYKHMRMERFTFPALSTLTTGSTFTYTTQNLQLAYVPHYVYVFVRESDANKTNASSDTFVTITSVATYFNNQNSLLSGADPTSLWKIAKSCGLIDSQVDFLGTSRSSGWASIGTTGSLFCAEFGRHIALGDSSLGIGSAGAFNFYMQLGLKNNSAASITAPTVYMVVAYDQDMTILPGGEVFLSTPNVPLASVASGGAEGMVKIPYPGHGQFGMGGSWSSFWAGVKKFFTSSKILSALAPMASMIPGVGPGVTSALQTGLNAVGLGAGGAYMSKKQLRQAIQEL